MEGLREMEEILVCSECKHWIEPGECYAKNDKDGTILCKKCFDKLVKKGVIK